MVPAFDKGLMVMENDTGQYICLVCQYVYDPAVGDRTADIPPGVPFEDLPDDWVCPECGVGKDQFEKQAL